MGPRQQEHTQHDKGNDNSLLLGTHEAASGVLCPALGSQYKTDVDILGRGSLGRRGICPNAVYGGDLVLLSIA